MGAVFRRNAPRRGRKTEALQRPVGIAHGDSFVIGQMRIRRADALAEFGRPHQDRHVAVGVLVIVHQLMRIGQLRPGEAPGHAGVHQPL